ncbi:MAG: LysR family transcriptional regulator [Candidatus Latescibacteria bacterium]|nr:LysR family transcriptional regulator [Candidatus Latescibacterota bacterium]NIM22028.1 LysR family transcriptional regulator [Candidatus Latescibacterota bacterium]NIM66046.1 LysR family transcriptional regulator [Candidatus Latescibacterota bacterium]NIO02454.1 LysR family transcriptional regulator [Candidatus Latescibacterota bacterium]NIO29365.1 LysR family transcriptional regulator [Candidatus Latescibacterota bacterium]
MEIRQMKYLLSTIRLGSVKEAAREHFITQPAVSIQLRKLEEELGEKLLIRSGRKAIPTMAGAAFIHRADDILQRIESLENWIQGFKGLQTGLLRLGSIDSASVYVLPSVFRSFRRKYPGIDIRVAVTDTRGLVRSLNAGEIELAIATLPLQSDEYQIEPIFKDQMVLVTSPRHEIARTRRWSLRAVAEIGLIMYPTQSTTRRLIEQTFMEAGATPRATMEISSPEAMKRLTEAGLGASILPVRLVAPEVRRGTLKVIPTGRLRFQRIMGIVYRDQDSLSPPGRVFLGMLKQKYTRQEKP